MKSKLCFATFVFGSYQKYIPYYIYSISKTYPESVIKIFIDGSLKKEISEALILIKNGNIKNFEVIQHYSALKEFQHLKIRGGNGKLNRWIIDSHFFSDFDFVYIGDVDILFLPEKISLFDFHKTQMHNLKVPFSNKVRSDFNGNSTKRLTGLHFIKTAEYFKKINPIIEKIKNNKEFRNNFFEGIERDEHFLYRLNKMAFDFEDEKLIQAQRPWHGLHLGISRGNKKINLNTIKKNSSLSINEMSKNLTIIAIDKLFQQIQKKVYVVELDEIFRALKIKRSVSWKLKNLNYKKNRKIKQFKAKVKRFLK